MGSLPDLSNSTELADVYANGNALTEVPAWLFAMEELEACYLGGNKIATFGILILI